jgi:hypothetical protein
MRGLRLLQQLSRGGSCRRSIRPGLRRGIRRETHQQKQRWRGRSQQARQSVSLYKAGIFPHGYTRAQQC